MFNILNQKKKLNESFNFFHIYSYFEHTEIVGKPLSISIRREKSARRKSFEQTKGTL